MGDLCSPVWPPRLLCSSWLHETGSVQPRLRWSRRHCSANQPGTLYSTVVCYTTCVPASVLYAVTEWPKIYTRNLSWEFSITKQGSLVLQVCQHLLTYMNILKCIYQYIDCWEWSCSCCSCYYCYVRISPSLPTSKALALWTSGGGA